MSQPRQTSIQNVIGVSKPQPEHKFAPFMQRAWLTVARTMVRLGYGRTTMNITSVPFFSTHSVIELRPFATVPKPRSNITVEGTAAPHLQRWVAHNLHDRHQPKKGEHHG